MGLAWTSKKSTETTSYYWTFTKWTYAMPFGMQQTIVRLSHRKLPDSRQTSTESTMPKNNMWFTKHSFLIPNTWSEFFLPVSTYWRRYFWSFVNALWMPDSVWLCAAAMVKTFSMLNSVITFFFTILIKCSSKRVHTSMQCNTQSDSTTTRMCCKMPWMWFSKSTS